MQRILIEAIARCGQRSAASQRVLSLLWAGRSSEEMRRELGDLSPTTLFSRVHRARRLLREVLAEDFGIDVGEAIREEGPS